MPTFNSTTRSMITIPTSEYEELKENAETLQALFEAGVDDWDGYSIAMKQLGETDGGR